MLMKFLECNSAMHEFVYVGCIVDMHVCTVHRHSCRMNESDITALEQSYDFGPKTVHNKAMTTYIVYIYSATNLA